MEKYIFDESNGLWYELQGDYYVPCLIVPAQDERPIGIWGQRRLRYIKTERKVLYTELLTSGKLYSYLADINEQATEQMLLLTKQILAKYWAVSMKKVDEVAGDEGLKESIGKYVIHIGSITEQVYQKEMEVPIEDMKRYLDGILHLYDKGRTKVSIPELFGIVDQAKQKLIEKGT